MERIPCSYKLGDLIVLRYSGCLLALRIIIPSFGYSQGFVENDNLIT